MAKKRRVTKTKLVNRTMKKASVKHHVKEPEYMIQINDPRTARKNILESLREVIIFMQNYEKFKSIQLEKVATFSQLKKDVSEINSMVDKLKHYFPKGKLKLISEEKHPEETVHQEPLMEKPKPVPAPVKKTVSELDELESQLKDIEGQLRTMN